MKMFRIFFVAALVACSLTASSFAESFNIFLKIDPAPGLTVQGEAPPPHEGEIEVASFKAGVLQKGAIFAGSGASAAKAELTPVTIFKFLDKASASLFVACATGVRFPKATLVVEMPVPAVAGFAVPPRRPAGEFFRIELRDVFITSVNHDANTTDSEGNLVETVTLSYTEIRWTYTPASENGEPGTPVTGGFNLKTNKKL